MSNYNTVTEAVQAPVAPVWFVSTAWQTEPLDEMVDRTRSSDGRWLKRNVSLNNATFVQIAANMELAESFDCDASDIFIGKRQ